jgi:hypothetical protein
MIGCPVSALVEEGGKMGAEKKENSFTRYTGGIINGEIV